MIKPDTIRACPLKYLKDEIQNKDDFTTPLSLTKSVADGFLENT